MSDNWKYVSIYVVCYNFLDEQNDKRITAYTVILRPAENIVRTVVTSISRLLNGS